MPERLQFADGTVMSTAATVNNGEWAPEDHGFVAWTYDPGQASGSTVLTTAGTVYTVRLKIRKPVSVTNIWYDVLNVGVSLTGGQCFVGLYQNGALLGVSADQAVPWVSATMKTTALVGGPFPLAPGEAIVAFVFNGSTGPGLGRLTAYSPAVNVGLSAANSRFGAANTGATSLPTTLGTITVGFAPNIWVGLS